MVRSAYLSAYDEEFTGAVVLMGFYMSRYCAYWSLPLLVRKR